MVRGRTINDWYLNRGASSVDDKTDDDVVDRGPDSWLDSAANSRGSSRTPPVGRSKRSALRRTNAESTPTPTLGRHAPKPSNRELDDEIASILRSQAKVSVRELLHRKGGGWARLTSKEIAVAVRRVQSRAKRTPKRSAVTAVAPLPAPAPVPVLPSMEEIRRTVIQIHAHRPLLATWEISRDLRAKGWSNVTTDLVKSILPPPGKSLFPSVHQRRRGKKKPHAGPKTSKALQSRAASGRAKPVAAPQAPTRQEPLKPATQLTVFCPSCEVRISVLGSCRCS